MMIFSARLTVALCLTFLVSCQKNDTNLESNLSESKVSLPDQTNSVGDSVNTTKGSLSNSRPEKKSNSTFRLHNESVLGYKVGDVYEKNDLIPGALHQKISPTKTGTGENNYPASILINIQKENAIGMMLDTDSGEIQKITVSSPMFKTADGAHVDMKLTEFMKIYRGKYELYYQYSENRMVAKTLAEPNLIFILDPSGYRGGPDKIKMLTKDPLSASDFGVNTKIIYVVYE